MLYTKYISAKLKGVSSNKKKKKKAKLPWKRKTQCLEKLLVFQKGDHGPCECHHSAFSLYLLAKCSYIGTFHTELGKVNINLS